MDQLDAYKFSVDDFTLHPTNNEILDAQSERLDCEFEHRGLWNMHAMADALGLHSGEPLETTEDQEDALFAEILETAKVPTLEPSVSSLPSRNEVFYPYDSKTMFLLDTLDNLPRLRISNSLMRVFLWILRELGAPDKSIRSRSGIPTIPAKSHFGNVFYINDPRHLIAQDWASPEVRKHICVYPEIPEDGVIREIWHDQKWQKDMDCDLLSPMYEGRRAHFYVNELARMEDGWYVIPKRWVTFLQEVYADVLIVEIDDSGFATVLNKESTTLIKASELSRNYLDLEHDGGLPKWADTCADLSVKMPNPKRALAEGDPLYTSFVEYFSDDVSGNRTKQWNKHWNVYMTHQNLPRQLLQQEFHVHFVSSSPHASTTSSTASLRRLSTQRELVKVRDGVSGQTTRFLLQNMVEPSDNPMQSEIAASMAQKETFHAASVRLVSGTPRSKDGIICELEKQLHLACSGVAQHVKDSQSATGIKDAYAQHWIQDLISRFHATKSDPKNTKTPEEIKADLIQWVMDNQDKIYSGFLTIDGFDPTKDTPVEILHTILLGIIKYIWHNTHTSFSATQKLTYSHRLQATETDGLSIHAIRANYIMQYAGSLIGTQFKILAQTNIFHVRGIVSEEQFSIWRAVGELSALLWFPEIRNLQEYLADIKVAVANVLDTFAKLDPSKMITKIKLHLLAHIPDDITSFGPLVGVATEIYECFNAVFRYCSILSNHLAPSRDIALQLADQEGLKHRLIGGWWQDEKGEWIRAGDGVRQYMCKQPVLRKLLGWTEKPALLIGSVRLKALPKKTSQKLVRLSETLAAGALNYASFNADIQWHYCKYAISESSEECFESSWVFCKSPLPNANNPIVLGRISFILTLAAPPPDTDEGVVVLELFQVLSERDPVFGMPVLMCRDGQKTYLIVPSKNLKFKFNVQHNCTTAKCTASGVRKRKQERQDSEVTENFIEHQPLDRYFINTHAFHNAHLVQATLPRSLTVPLPIVDDRKAFHSELAKPQKKQQQALGNKSAEKAIPPANQKQNKHEKRKQQHLNLGLG
ncbi:hypothetical protein CPB85DRAFT_1493392 [Mucidula mucida]|nr:hypothetical protein CPB85DRAFT_1493392 [Mucidula mucida]